MTTSPQARPRGVFIVLEGIDGSGKTTQRERLKKSLEADGQRVHVTAEPSTGPLGVNIRDRLAGTKPVNEETLALLFAADRRDHLGDEIIPALDEGAVVICDRYVMSSLAYQSFSLSEAWIAALNDGLRAPDLTLLLRLAPEEAAKRRASRNLAEDALEKADRQRQVAERYDTLMGRIAHTAGCVVDANQEEDAVAAALYAAVATVIQERRCD